MKLTYTRTGEAVVADLDVGELLGGYVGPISVTVPVNGAGNREWEEIVRRELEIATPVEAPQPYAIPKLTIITRMTDEQLDLFDTQLAAQPVRFRRSWLDAQEVHSDHPFHQVLLDAMTQAWGEAEATRILGP